MARVYRSDGSRDYRAEYRQRIDRLTAAGYSRSVARGHAKTRQIREGKTGELRTIKIERPLRVERIRARIERDRQAVFGGNLPKAMRGEVASGAYEKRLERLREDAGKYSWDDRETFIDEMRDEGLTEHEANELWFGY